MSYKQRLNQPYEFANSNLIFHRQTPQERWCFPRAHLVYAAAGQDRIEFRFPMYAGVVTLPEAEATLKLVLAGSDSVFVEAFGSDAAAASSGGEQSPIPAEKISILNLQDEIF